MGACWIRKDKMGKGYWHFWNLGGERKTRLRTMPNPCLDANGSPSRLTNHSTTFQEAAKQLMATSRPHFIYDKDQQLWMPDLQVGDILEVGVNQNGRPRWITTIDHGGSGNVAQGIVDSVNFNGECWYKIFNTDWVIILPNHPCFPGYGKPGWPHRICEASQEATESPQKAAQTPLAPEYLAVVKQPPLDGYGPIAQARTWDQQVDEVRRALQRTERFAPLCQSCGCPKTLWSRKIANDSYGINWECREGCGK